MTYLLVFTIVFLIIFKHFLPILIGRLLIWEESYYEPSTYSGIHGVPMVENPELPFHDWGVCWGPGEVRNPQLMNQAGERVQLLVNKMMMESQINIVGEGYTIWTFSLLIFIFFIKSIEKIVCLYHVVDMNNFASQTSRTGRSYWESSVVSFRGFK